MQYNYIGIAIIINLALIFGAASTQTVIRGTIRSATGEPPVLSHVHWREWISSDSLHSVAANPDGTFLLTTNRVGVTSFWFSGVNHAEFREFLPLIPMDTVILSVTLATVVYQSPIDSLMLINTDIDSENIRGTRMQPLGDKYWARIAISDNSSAYQISGFRPKIQGVYIPPINGTQATRYRYDGRGNYISIIDTIADSVDVYFDPGMFPRLNKPGGIVVECSTCIAKAIVSLSHSVLELRDLDDSSRIAKQSELARKFITAKDTLSRAITLILLIESQDKFIKPEWAQQVIEEAGPTSILWSLNPNWAQQLLAISTEAFPAYYDFIDRIIDEHNDSNIVASLLYNMASRAKGSGNDQEFQYYFGRLISEYPDLSWTKSAKSHWAPKLAVGMSAPDFQYFGDDGTVKSLSDLRGKIVLIDFWGTWCGPCKGEMPMLHSLYEKYGKDGLIIISPAIDDTDQSVAHFRKTKWSMPWIVPVLSTEDGNALKEKYGVVGIPWAAVIDQNGILHAVHIRGRKIEAVIQELLRK